jgi:thiamine-monophosphate kinase
VDISDGLSRDLRRICEPSRVGAILEGARVPIHRDERRFRKEGRLLRAISGGEEYELLFAAPPEKARQLEGRGVAGRRVFRIGRVVDRAAGVVVQGESTLLEALPDSGYIHFKHVPVEPHLPRRSR